MTDNFGKNPHVDESGIRLAPTPLGGTAPKTMPGIRQEFVIVPRLETPTAAGTAEGGAAVSTSADYQPKSRDLSKLRARRMRTRNFGVGLVMAAVSALVLLPFVFAVCGVSVDFLPFRFVPQQYNVVQGWIDAFSETAALGWTGEQVGAVWAAMVPDMLLTVGIIAVLVNLVKAVTGMCFALRPRRYLPGATVFLMSVCAVFIAALVGAEDIGVAQIDFMQDFIHGYATSEFFTFFVLAGVNLVAAFVCSLVTPPRTGYTRGK